MKCVDCKFFFPVEKLAALQHKDASEFGVCPFFVEKAEINRVIPYLSYSKGAEVMTMTVKLVKKEDEQCTQFYKKSIIAESDKVRLIREDKS